MHQSLVPKEREREREIHLASAQHSLLVKDLWDNFFIIKIYFLCLSHNKNRISCVV